MKRNKIVKELKTVINNYEEILKNKNKNHELATSYLIDLLRDYADELEKKEK